MLFEEQISRKPDLYPWTKDFMRAMWEGHWTDREFSFSSDKQDFHVKLSDEEKTCIVRALSAIGQIEVAVKTFWAKLGDNLPHPSIQDMGYVMANVECYSEDTDVLTPSGWRKLIDMEVGDSVYQYNPNTDELEKTVVRDTVKKPYTGQVYKFGDRQNQCVVTPNHEMIIKRQKNKTQWEVDRVKAKDFRSHSAIKVPRVAKLKKMKNQIDNLSPLERLFIAIQADGTRCYNYYANGERFFRGANGGYTHSIRIKKQRKIDRLREILSICDVKYTENYLSDGDTCVFYLYLNDYDTDFKDFSEWIDLTNKSSNWCFEFVEELLHWDGSLKQKSYFSKIKSNVDFCQHVGLLAGLYSSTSFSVDERPGFSTKYRVSFSNGKNNWCYTTNMAKEIVNYDGLVSCITVDSGAILTRRNGKTFIAGNCIHNSAYERLLEELGLSDIFEKNLELEWMSGRVKYLRKYTHKYYKDSKKQFVYALALFTLFVENVSLFSQFYVINWFGRKNLLKDTNQQVAYTIREEDLHAKVGIKLINVLRQEYPELFDNELEEKLIHEAEEAFVAESKIIDWIVGDIDTEFLSPSILKEFIKNRINDSLIAIGFKKVFAVDQQILSKTVWFDEAALGNSMADFFHSRPTEYQKAAKSFDEGSLF